MKEWIIKYRWKKGRDNKFFKKCKCCGKNFLSNGPKEHCSWKCFLILRKNIDENGCWIWKGSLSNKGYGKTSNSKLIHRLSYEEFVGKIPKCEFVCHKCDNPSCFNPDHLFLGNQTDNMSDCVKKGRRPDFKRGKNPMCKLSEEDVINIRKMLKEGIKGIRLAEKYSVSTASISLIKNGINWK